uniref:Oral cancer overexpressed 1 n=1 Tax=Balaenoptera musculus TaxID=9771 RepID=A0A8C0E8N5_BALMU
KIGSEIGCYQGFAFAWRCLLHGCATEKDSKKMKVLESLIGMIQKFPYDDPTYDKLHEDLDKIRGKFKHLCSLLNIQPDFKISAEGSGLHFEDDRRTKTKQKGTDVCMLSV